MIRFVRVYDSTDLLLNERVLFEYGTYLNNFVVSEIDIQKNKVKITSLESPGWTINLNVSPNIILYKAIEVH